MKLVEFTRYTGTKFSINPDYVAYVVPAENGTNIFVMGGSTFMVTESYNTVIGLLTDDGLPWRAMQDVAMQAGAL